MKSANQYGRTQRKLYLVVGEDSFTGVDNFVQGVYTSRSQARAARARFNNEYIVEMPLTKEQLGILKQVTF